MLGDGSFTPVAGSTAAGALTVLDGRHTLPVGLLFAQAAGGRAKLYAAPGLPTADDPHAIIAAIGVVQKPGRYPSARAVLDAFKKKASELGANALFRPDAHSMYAYALHLSSAAPTAEHPDHEALLKKEIADLAGFRPAGAPRSAELSAVAPLEISVARGRCYAVVVALDKSARLGDDGQQHLVLSMKSDDPMMLQRSHMATEDVAEADGFKLQAPMAGRYVALRSFGGQFGCAWNRQGTAVVSLQTRGRSASIGTGDVWLQVLEQPISEAKLRAKKKELDAAMAEAAERAREFERQEAIRQAERERERAAREREQAARQAQADQARTTGAAAGSGHFSFWLKNECRQTVRMFINDGGNPRFSGGTGTTMSANSLQSFSGSGQKTYWIVNDSGEGISSFTAGPGQRDMRILPSCTGFAPR